MERNQITAIGLISGGLDSTLAACVLVEQGLNVIGLNFSTGFCKTDARRAVNRPGERPERLRHEGLRAGADAGIPIEVIDVAEEYLKMVLNPKHGYGRVMNPCIDCRIFMLRKAKAYMEEAGGHFVFTGEVLGQRPMSQHRQALREIEREAGLQGYLLRPLSAAFLEPTAPEKEGWVDRDRLPAIRGRGRRIQMELAAKYGVLDYPQPSGGCCFLTDENFGRRFRDKIDHTGADRISPDDLVFLKVGRHLRLGPDLKIVVGRDEPENNFLERYRQGRWAAEALDCSSPLTLVEGDPDPAQRERIAAITARYSNARDRERVRVHLARDDEQEIRTVAPASDADCGRLLV
jgi:tRNA U34 2-thiouridine synthase MnmA/TrmU